MARDHCGFRQPPPSQRTQKRCTIRLRYDWRLASFVPGGLDRYRLSYEQRLFSSSIASSRIGPACLVSALGAVDQSNAQPLPVAHVLRALTS